MRRKCISYDSHLFGTNLAVQREIKKERFRIAKNLLERTNLPLKEVAQLVGLPLDELKSFVNRENVDREKSVYTFSREESLIERLAKDLDKLKREES